MWQHTLFADLNLKVARNPECFLDKYGIYNIERLIRSIRQAPAHLVAGLDYNGLIRNYYLFTGCNRVHLPAQGAIRRHNIKL